MDKKGEFITWNASRSPALFTFCSRIPAVFMSAEFSSELLLFGGGSTKMSRSWTGEHAQGDGEMVINSLIAF